MVAPVIAGALIGGGASLLGGLFGAKKSKESVREQQEREYAMQKEFAQHGVRWRVEDAKAAGLHPLYALGAQLPTFSPSYSMDSSGSQIGGAISEMGQSLGRAVGAGQTRAEKELAQIQLATAAKGLQEADARIAALTSEAYRNYQEGLAATSFPTSAPATLVPEGQAPRVGVGMTNVQPTTTPTVSTENAGIAAGVPSMAREYRTPFGFPMLLPSETSGSSAEAFESVSESPYSMLAWGLINVAHYGQGWLQKAAASGEPVIRNMARAVERNRGAVREFRESRGHGRPSAYRTGGRF